MPDLLLELLSEEIPARMQARAAEDLRRLVTDGLVERGLTYAEAAAFVTPRRLTLALTDLTPRSPDLREERKGPRTDAPEAAVEGFLRSTGLAPRGARDPRRQEGAGLLRRHHPPRPPRRRDRRRSRRGRGPRLSLAEVDALGDGRAALGAAAAFDPLHAHVPRRGPRSCRSRSTASSRATSRAVTASWRRADLVGAPSSPTTPTSCATPLS